MEPRAGSLHAFWRDDRGALYATTSYLVTTVAVSLPLGLMLYAVYDTLCAAGRYTNFVLGLF